MDMEEIVALSVKHNVSDLHLCSDGPPRWRRQGRLEAAPFPPPDPDALLQAFLDEQQRDEWRTRRQVDFALSLNHHRLRASAFRHHRGTSLALRLLPDRCPTLAALETRNGVKDGEMRGIRQNRKPHIIKYRFLSCLCHE